MFQKIRILLIEDSLADAILIRETLSEEESKNYQFTHVSELKSAYHKLNHLSFDLILMDLSLPDANGFSNIQHIHQAAGGIPIIVLTGNIDETKAFHALEMGAYDYLVKKNVNSQLLTRSIRYALERYHSENRLHHAIHHDILTDLPNRNFFKEQFNHYLDRASRFQKRMAVITMDLDRFKMINDTLGHETGDVLLQSVAQRLLDSILKKDAVARVGGDEFTIILDCIENDTEVQTTVTNIIQSISKPFKLNESDLFITASLGITIYPDDGIDAKTLIKNADIAIHHAKAKGRNNFQFYKDIEESPSLERIVLENNLRLALEKNEIQLYYQPQVDIHTHKIIAMEALVRWQHPEFGLIGPKDFIPLAEDIGFIIPLGEWVLYTACQQNKVWQDYGFPPIRISVNFSAVQFEQADFENMIINVLKETGMDPNYLEVEITESVLMRDIEYTKDILSTLKKVGVHIAIDDFGTGYSSLSYLKKFPIETLKIDQSFIQDITTDADDRAITKAITAMAQSLNIQIVAEGVETEGQLEYLKTLHCQKIQGYFISHPLPSYESTKLLFEENNLFNIAKNKQIFD